MELAAMVFFPVLAGVLALAAAILLGLTSHRDLGIWVSCGSAICLVLAGTCAIQDRAWKNDAAAMPLPGDQRPWLTILPPVLEQDIPSGRFHGIVEVHNGGKTPAYIYGSDVAIIPSAKDDPSNQVNKDLIDRFNASERHTGQDYMVPPDGHLRLHTYADDGFAPDVMERVTNGSAEILVMARVYYKDERGGDHESRMAFVSVSATGKPGDFHVFPHGGKMD